MPGSFFDTNVLLYAVSSDLRKAEIASDLIRRGGTISVQNLNEYANVSRRKLNLPWERLHLHLAALRATLDVVPLTVSIYERGLRVAERYGISTYDAMVAAAALESDCETLWSENMQNRLVISSLTIQNPFTSIGR